MLDGWLKVDPLTVKNIPVEVGITDFITKIGRKHGTLALEKATGELCLIFFYYLLLVGEHTVKGKSNNTKK